MNRETIAGALPVLLTATLLRVLLAPFTGHPVDLSIWMTVGGKIANLLSPYELQPTLGYPPLWAFWCGAAYALSGLIVPRNNFAYVFLIKVPIIVADIAIALLLLSSSVEQKSTSPTHLRVCPASGIALAELFLFNPYAMIVGVVWSMMDNIVALLVILMVIALTRGKYLWAGFLLSLSIALKLYPILFLPVCLIYIAKKDFRVERSLQFLVTLSTTAFALVTLPFLILHWNTVGLLNVLIAQGIRIPGGISPIGIFTYLPNVGVTNLGPFSVLSLSSNVWLRLIWVPVVAVGFLYLYRREKFSKIASLYDGLILTYVIYILFAPWVSEQSVETMLVLLLFAGTSKRYELRQYGPYLVGSIIVFVFIVLHVPVTSFLYPVLAIDPTPFLVFGAPFLPWIVLAFGAYCLAVIRSVMRDMGRGRRRNQG